MKKISLSFLFFLFLLIGCSTDETVLNSTDSNLETNLSQDIETIDEAAINNNSTTKPLSQTSKDEKGVNSTSRSEIGQDSNPDLGGNDGNNDGDSDGNTNNIDPSCNNWVAPAGSPNEDEYELIIYYNAFEISVDEINCIRQEYFTDFPYLKMAISQNTSPFIDVWVDQKPPCFDTNEGCTSAGATQSPASKKAGNDNRTSNTNPPDPNDPIDGPN